MIGTVTVIGIFSSFCALLRCSAIMVPSQNDIMDVWSFMWYVSYQTEVLHLAAAA